MEKASGKIAYLDGIRGVAALFVFFHHFLLAFYSAYFNFDQQQAHFATAEIDYGKSVFSVFTNGTFYISVFFVLSGFVLSRKYYETNNFETIISSAHRRFLRLYIPIAFTILLSALLMLSHLYFNTEASKITLSGWLPCFWNFQDIGPQLWNSLTIGTMFRGNAVFDNSMWTISNELYGSIFVFCFLAITHRTRNKFTMLMLLFLLFFMLNDHGYYSSFILGMSFNYIVQIKDKANKYILRVIAVLSMLLALVLGSYPTQDLIGGTLFAKLPAAIVIWHEWFLTIGAFLFVLAFVLSSSLQRFISMKFFRFLGYISFSFYLLHPIIIGSFSSYFFLKLYTYCGYHTSVIFVFFATILVAFSGSWLMAKYIDESGIRLSKYVYERWFKKAA